MRLKELVQPIWKLESMGNISNEINTEILNSKVGDFDVPIQTEHGHVHGKNNSGPYPPKPKPTWVRLSRKDSGPLDQNKAAPIIKLGKRDAQQIPSDETDAERDVHSAKRGKVEVSNINNGSARVVDHRCRTQ